jgi:hypothetical protein
MKNCGKIQQELSAYLDGELTPSLRAEVETHLTSCAQCRQELSEMQTLATGVAALSNLKPTPQFLADVRRKIARAEKPGPLDWRDYVLRPLWLKVPLEAAALIVIIGFVMRSQRPLPTQKIAQLESARTENNEKDRVNRVSSETVAKVTVLDALKATRADKAPTAGKPSDGLAAPVVKAELSQSGEMLNKKESGVDTAQTSGPAITGDLRQFADKSAGNEMAEGGARRIPVIHGVDEASLTPSSGPSPIIGAIRSLELAQSQFSETVTVHARDFDDVRNRAQQLAVRCGGRVVTVPQSKDAMEQTLFVELPQEYVAAFKLELLKTSGLPTAPTKGGNAGQLVATNTTASLAGVLTGSAITNNSLNAPGSLGLRDDTTAAPNTVLEIRVVAPAN